MLRDLCDHLPASAILIDADGRVRYANRAAAARAGLDVEDVPGRSLAGVLGSGAADGWRADAHQAALERMAISRTRHTLQGSAAATWLAKTIPMPNGDTLLWEENITPAIDNHVRSLRLERRLVDTLLSVADRRDPYALRHSARVAAVARAVAKEMGMSDADATVVETAGKLMNVGKLLVPVEVLTKAGELTAEERTTVRHSIQAGVELLTGVDFDGPVIDVLRQMHEHVDGSGTPAGLKGEEILAGARVLAVANAFVGMVSDRSHRPAHTIDAAVDALFAAAGTRLDRAVVSALVNFLENKGGRAQFAIGAEDRPALTHEA